MISSTYELYFYFKFKTFLEPRPIWAYCLICQNLVAYCDQVLTVWTATKLIMISRNTSSWLVSVPDFDFHNHLYVSFLKQASIWTCSWMFWISAKSFNKFAKNRGHFFAGIPWLCFKRLEPDRLTSFICVFRFVLARVTAER
jgi:hypothetical protein